MVSKDASQIAENSTWFVLAYVIDLIYTKHRNSVLEKKCSKSFLKKCIEKNLRIWAICISIKKCL